MSLNKLFLRWIAVFGLVGLFAVFGWGKGHNVFHENPFTPVFPNGGLRLYGDFVATGDSVLCQNNGAGGCNNAYNGYLYDTNLIYKNEEGMTLNSSSSTLTLPPDIGSNEIEWAGLYWQGHIADQNANRYSTSALVQNRGNVTFKLPDGTEQNITADKVWYHDFWGDGSGSRGGFRSFYQGFKDVTSLVKSHLVNGATQTFSVGNLKATHGRDWFSYFYLGQGAEYNGLKIGFWGNWSLIVVYKHNPATMPSGTTMKNINVFNGFDAMFPLPINGYETFDVEIPVSGFLTPKSGVVNAKMLFYASGGEKRINRDAFYIQNANNAYKYTAVSNTANPANNPFNGSVSNFGIPIDATINYYPGFDLDVYNVSNYMTNDQTSTALKLEAIFKSNNGDQSTPGAIAFSADLYTPSFCYDYTLKQDGRYLSIDRTDPIARINQQISSSPIELLVYLKNKEADILANGISIKADVNATRFDYAMTNPMYVSNPNGSSLIDRGKPYSSTNCFYSIGSGNGVSDAGCVALIENDTSTTNDDIRRIRKGNGALGSEEYIYTKFILNPQQIVGALDDINESLGLTLDYYISVGSTVVPYYDYPLGGPNVPLCTPSNVYAPAWGQFNVVESKTEPNLTPFNNIKTQISRRPFNVDVAYDASPGTGTNDLPIGDINTTVVVEMIDVDSFGDINASCANPDAGVSAPIVVPLTITSADNTDPIPAQNESYYNFALKNGAFRVWYFTDSNGSLIENWTASTSDQGKTVNSISGLFNSAWHGDCNSSCGVSGGSSTSSACFTCIKEYYGKPLCSRDNFSVRPEAFDVRIKDFPNPADLTINTDLTHDTYGYAPDTTPVGGRMNLAAGYDYRYDLTATGNETNGSSAFVPVPRYTRYFNGANPDYNITMYWDSPLTASECNDVSNRNITAYLVNGVRQNQTNLQNQVGDYRLNMIDKSWTAVDQITTNANRTVFRGFDITTDCVANSNSTQPDGSGKYGCEISSSHINGGLTYKDQNLTFKPAKFDLSTFTYGLGKNMQSITTGGQGFVYMSDLNKSNDMNMSVRGNGEIKAVGANNSVLSNFVGGCFAKDLNVSLEHDANLTYTTPFVARMVNSTLAGVQSHDTLEIPLTSQWIAGVDDSNFTKIDNGSVVTAIRFNFDRNQTTAHSPQTVAYGDLNVSCAVSSDCNMSAMRNLPVADMPVGTSAMDFNITHVYGRIIPRNVRVFGNVDFTANAWYEVWNAPIIGTKGLPPSKNGSGWYINTLHENLNDGDAAVSFVIPTSGSQPVGTTGYSNGVESYNFPAFAIQQGYRAHIDTEGWLWYGLGMNEYSDPSNPGNVDCTTHPCFNITVVPAVGRAGSSTSDDLRGDKANKSTSAPTGVTYDYSPAL